MAIIEELDNIEVQASQGYKSIDSESCRLEIMVSFNSSSVKMDASKGNRLFDSFPMFYQQRSNEDEAYMYTNFLRWLNESATNNDGSPNFDYIKNLVKNPIVKL